MLHGVQALHRRELDTQACSQLTEVSRNLLSGSDSSASIDGLHSCLRNCTNLFLILNF